MEKYSIGLLHCKGFVAMVRKARPPWQAGKLNLPGGKLQDGETYHAALVREFQEETGLNLPGASHCGYADLDTCSASTRLKLTR